MHTPTCRHTHTHKHLQVSVLEFMGHLIYRHTICLDPRCTDTKGDRLRSSVRRDTCQCEEKSTRGFYLQRRTFLRVEATVVQPFRPSVRGRLDRKRGGEEEKLPFSCSFPPNPPLLLPGVAPLSRQHPGGNERPRGRDDLREMLISSFNTMIVLTIFKL